MNNVIYFESNYLKQEYIHQWKSKGDLFHYTLEDAERLAPAIASQYFHFAVFIFDVYTPEKQKLVKSVTDLKQDMPFFIIANSYEETDDLKNIEEQLANRIYYFTPDEIKDLPGMILRALKTKTYHRRINSRVKVKQSAILVIDNKQISVTLKDLSKSGARVELRRDPKVLTQKQATLIHTKFDGTEVKVPVELCWATVGSDGRLHLGTKFQKVH